MQRQADYIAIGTANPGNERSGLALDGVTTCFADALLALGVFFNFTAVEALEEDLGHHNALYKFLILFDTQGGVDAVPAARKLQQATAHFVFTLCFWENAAAIGDDGVGGENGAVWMKFCDGAGFFSG